MASKQFSSLVVFLVVVVSLPALVASQNLARAVWLSEEVTEATGARCLDGSPGLYFIRNSNSTANNTKWVFHIQGGGWCVSDESCYERVFSYLGSSNETYHPCNGSPEYCTQDFGNINGCNDTRWCGAPIMNDLTINPIAWDWNAVLLMYCDGGSWTGNNENPVVYNGVTMYYRGFRLLNAILDDLMQNQGLDKATDVLFGGDSAGGLATYTHIDFIASKLPAGAKLLGIPDSGYFMDMPGNSFFEWIFTAMNSSSGVNQDCLQYYSAQGEAYKCIYAQYTVPFIKTRIWPIQSQYDPAQPMASSTPAYINSYGQNLSDSFISTVLRTPQNGAWLYSCYQHCGGWELGVEGTTAIEALQQVYNGWGATSFWFQNATFPCLSCCNPPNS